MLPPEIVQQIRRLHLRARRAVHSLIGGEYLSAFKGTGLSFEEVREYQPGDDVRNIDWNVTARIGHPFVKRFVEERELTVLLAVDVSGSLRFGTQLHSKRAAAAEIAALLAFAAVQNNDRIGLLAFSDRIERHVPPGKGVRHVLRLIRDVLFYEPARHGTGLRAALDELNRVQRRRAVVFLLSDFLDSGFERALRITGRRHDLIAVHLTDAREAELPDVGLLSLEDAETGDQMIVDTSDRRVREAFARQAAARREAVRKLARSAGADLIEADTAGGHLDALVRFFRLRERRRGRA